MAVNYNRTEWKNNQTPLNQTNMNNIESGIVNLANAYNGAPFTPDEYNLLRSMIDENFVFTAMRAVADDKGNNIYNSYARKSTLTGGSATRPVYLNNGAVNPCTYELNKSVPSDAKFTDTTDLSQMTGVLPVEHGGTGSSNASAARVALGLGGAATKAIKDNSSATALTSSGTNLVTERTVYNGTPSINNSHAYTSSSNFYAPTGAGTAGQILKSSGGTSAPVWANASDITVGTATHAVSADTATTATSAGTATRALQDEDGNNIKATYSKKANTIKSLVFNSDASVTITTDSGTVTSQTVYGALADSTWFGPTAPTNKKMIWVDTANGYIQKVYDSTTERWMTPRSVWG